MRIDHLALYVNDLAAAREFFERFFGATADAGYHNPNTGLRTHFLQFDDGARVTGDGYYESCVLGVEDNQIEITV